MKPIVDIKETVHNYYWKEDINCAATTLLTLSKYFSIELSQQVVDSAIGMHGAGKYGAQCGLVEGTLLFIGIYGRHKNIKNEIIVRICNLFAEKFENEFSSLLCSKLRPGGFNPEDPEHLCENITVKGIILGITFINEHTYNAEL